MEVLNTCPALINIPFLVLKNIYLNAINLKFRKGDAVFQEGEYANGIYIIREGEFALK